MLKGLSVSHVIACVAVKHKRDVGGHSDFTIRQEKENCTRYFVYKCDVHSPPKCYYNHVLVSPIVLNN